MVDGNSDAASRVIKKMFGKLIHWIDNRRRDRALRNFPISDSAWHTALTSLPFLAYLNASELTRLRELTSLFIAQKSFSTAHELELTDEMLISIAMQACLPILNLSLDLYSGWVGIIVYPGEFVIRRTIEDENGVVHVIEHDASGEAWEGGPVILSWQDAQITGETYNVVIHEFAHKIDMLNGEIDGHPPFFRRWHAPLNATAWANIFDSAYEKFRARANTISPRQRADFERDSLIDPYAADHPAEFFAVCSETFFVQPQAFKTQYPDLYRLFAQYYRQDPALIRPTPQ